MWILFTSARSWLYKRDLLNIICDAKKAQIQFAYKEKWVAQSFLSRLEEMSNQDALIVYAEQVGPDSEVFRYHPVRYAKILKSAPEFYSVTLLLELHEFLDYHKASAEDFQKLFSEVDENPTRAKGGKFVVAATMPPKYLSSDQWIPTVTHFADLNPLRDCIFLTMQKTDEHSLRPAPLLPKAEYKDGIATYSVNAGHEQILSGLMIRGANASLRLPHLIVTNEVGSVAGPFLRQRGSGIEVLFYLKMNNTLEETSSSILFEISGNTDADIYSPQLQGVLKCKISNLVKISGLFLLPLLAGMLAMDIAIVKGLFTSGWIYDNALPVVLLIKIFSGLGLAVGYYFISRKVSFK